MLTWRDIVIYGRLFVRWWYVLALSVILSTGTAWYILRRQPELYISQATLVVGNNFSVASPNGDAVRLSNVLASYYASMVRREVILTPVAERLGLEFPWTIIRDRMLSVGIDQGANLLELTVLDTDSERGAAIANAIADELIAYTPNASSQAEAQQAEVERQLNEAQENVRATEAKIAELEGRLKTLSSAIDISDLQQQLEALEQTREKYLADYANLLELRNQSSVNSLKLLEQARPSPLPVPKKLALTVGVAALAGLALAILAVLLLDRLDEHWRSGADLHHRTGIKSLGEIPGSRPTTAALPLPQRERRERAVRDTYGNLIMAGGGQLPRSLLLSSPRPSLERSALAIDIAEMYVRAGHQVVLVEAETGRSDLAPLLEEHGSDSAYGSQNAWHRGQSAWPPGTAGIWHYVRPTRRPGIMLLSGHVSGHSSFASLVPSLYWPEMMKFLHQAADVVIFDGPAALAGPEAALLAPLVDGVVLTLNGRHDKRSTVIKARRMLVGQGASHFLGAIITSSSSTAGTANLRPKAETASEKSLRILVGPKGITISYGRALVDGALEGKPSTDAFGHRLLPPGQETTDDSPQVVEAVGHDASKITWEHLVELERHVGAATAPGGRWPQQPTLDNGRLNGVIITPPPDSAVAVEAEAPHTSAAARAETRSRKPRIAHGRRAGKVGRKPHSSAR